MVNWLRSLIMGVSLGVLLTGNATAEQLLMFSNSFPGRNYLSESKKLNIVNELNVILPFYGFKGDIELVRVSESSKTINDADYGNIYFFYTGEFQEDGSFKRTGPLEIVNLPWNWHNGFRPYTYGEKVTEIEYAGEETSKEASNSSKEINKIKSVLENKVNKLIANAESDEQVTYNFYSDSDWNVSLVKEQDNGSLVLNYSAVSNRYNVSMNGDTPEEEESQLSVNFYFDEDSLIITDIYTSLPEAEYNHPDVIIEGLTYFSSTKYPDFFQIHTIRYNN